MATPAILKESAPKAGSKASQRKGPLDVDALDVIYVDDDRSPRAHILNWIAYRAQGMKNVEIAPLLGLTPHSLNVLIWKANKEGWLKYNDPLERFNNQIVPKVVDNIDHFIDAKDRAMTIAAAQGAGIFRAHQVVKSEGDTPQTILALKIETVDGGETKVLTGHVVGKAREIEE